MAGSVRVPSPSRRSGLRDRGRERCCTGMDSPSMSAGGVPLPRRSDPGGRADDYVGEAVLTPTDEGTSITWTVTFRARYRGTRALCRLAVWLILGDLSRRLARVSAVEDASAAP
jgi:hypothetical protein